MDNFHHLQVNLPVPEFLVFAVSIVLVFTVFRYAVLNDSHEQPVSFKVPAPPQCDPKWNGEIVDNPSIKVFASCMSLSVQTAADYNLRSLGAVLYNAIVPPMVDYLAL